MINWQKIWDDEENAGIDWPFKIILSVLSFFYQFIISFRNWLYDRKILQ